MDTWKRYTWAGNVRELRNVIERSVIISCDETLRVPPFQELEQISEPVTLAEYEREHILRILERTKWHIKGPCGAANLLGLKPSTLYTRMRKLGIPNQHQRDGYGLKVGITSSQFFSQCHSPIPKDRIIFS